MAPLTFPDKPTEQHVRTAQDAAFKAKATADNATEEVKKAGIELTSAQEQLYNATRDLIVASGGSDPATVNVAKLKYDKAVADLKVKTNAHYNATATESSAYRDFVQKHGEYSTIWAASKTGDTVVDAQNRTQVAFVSGNADLKKTVADGNEGVKQSFAERTKDTIDIVRGEHNDTRKWVGEHVNTALGEHLTGKYP